MRTHRVACQDETSQRPLDLSAAPPTPPATAASTAATSAFARPTWRKISQLRPSSLTIQAMQKRFHEARNDLAPRPTQGRSGHWQHLDPHRHWRRGGLDLDHLRYRPGYRHADRLGCVRSLWHGNSDGLCGTGSDASLTFTAERPVYACLVLNQVDGALWADLHARAAPRTASLLDDDQMGAPPSLCILEGPTPIIDASPLSATPNHR